MTRLTLLLLALLLAGRASPADRFVPRTGPERAVLHTVTGDIVLAFYPDIAPRNVAQVLRLMRLGAYDTTHFYRVEPNFVLQVSNARDRLAPLTLPQLASIGKLPMEVHKDVLHHRGSISMARMPDDPNGAETSFSILLGDAPHLDGQYTIIGHVERGFEAIGEMLKVSRDSNHRPVARLTVYSVSVHDSPEGLAAAPFREAMAAGDPNAMSESRLLAFRYALAGGLALIILLSLAGFFGFGRIPVRAHASLHLLVVLVAVFLTITVLQPVAGQTPLVGACLFLALVATFRLLGRFENP